MTTETELGPERSTDALLHELLGAAREPRLSPEFQDRLLEGLERELDQAEERMAGRRRVFEILAGYALGALVGIVWILLALPRPADPSLLPLFLAGGGLCLVLSTAAALATFRPLRTSR